MSVTLRNYNGMYAVFLEMENEKELILSTEFLAEANKAIEEMHNKIKNSSCFM